MRTMLIYNSCGAHLQLASCICALELLEDVTQAMQVILGRPSLQLTLQLDATLNTQIHCLRVSRQAQVESTARVGCSRSSGCAGGSLLDKLRGERM